MYRYIKHLLVIFILGITYNIHAQFIINGSVVDLEGAPLVGANITVQETGEKTISDEIGSFVLNLKEEGSYTIIAYYISHTSLQKTITLTSAQSIIDLDFVLELDPLQLSQVVIIDRTNSQSSLVLSQKISTLSGDVVNSFGSYGTADLLGNVPGMFSDASAGEVFTRTYSRGISISAEDDLGWFYIGLEEDGLPITNSQHTYYSPDLFHRHDITIDRLEGINGGKSAIRGLNSPGALFNFKSITGGSRTLNRVVATGGIEGNNPMGRLDALFSGPLNQQWHYMVGGFYRKSQGPRDVEIDWNKGGQLKANISRLSQRSSLILHMKYLNDHTNRYFGLPAQNWDDPEEAFGVDFNNTALMLPPVDASLPDPRSGETYEFNSDNGIHTRDIALGFTYQYGLGQWNLKNQFRFSDKQADWQTSIGNQPLHLTGFFPYLLSGISPDFSTIPLGNVIFRDATNGETVASINNFGILGPLMGEDPSFTYLNGKLPNDAVMGIAPWKKIDNAQEWMNKMSLSGAVGNHDIDASVFYGRSNINTFTHASFAYVTYETQPRLLVTTVENPGEPILHLSDENGLSNHGGLFYNNASATVQQLALALTDQWAISEDWIVDLGLQYNRRNQMGSKDNALPSDLDNDQNTAYNNSFLSAAGSDDFDLTYDYLSWSTGVLRKLSNYSSVYGRFTRGHKSPELNYVFNNFQGIPVTEPGKTQVIKQLELGYRTRSASSALSLSTFYSDLSNVAFSEFVFDEETGTLFFTPEQINQTTTLGITAEAFTTLNRFFRIVAKTTLQRPRATTFTIYDAAGTGSTDDDQVLDFSGNDIPHNPKIMFEITPEVTLAKNRIYLKYKYMGSRAGNIENAFTLPAFGTLHAGIDFAYDDHTSFQLIANNILNSAGLMNFFGPNEFGSSANAASASFIQSNPNASFVVFPVMPRSIYVKMDHRF